LLRELLRRFLPDEEQANRNGSQPDAAGKLPAENSRKLKLSAFEKTKAACDKIALPFIF